MPWYRRKSVLAALAAVMAGVLALAGFLIFRGKPAPARPDATLSPAARGQPPLRSPFTGELVSSLGPVLAVKIDNIVNARPQTG